MTCGKTVRGEMKEPNRGYECVYCKEICESMDKLNDHVKIVHIWKRNAD